MEAGEDVNVGRAIKGAAWALSWLLLGGLPWNMGRRYATLAGVWSGVRESRLRSEGKLPPLTMAELQKRRKRRGGAAQAATDYRRPYVRPEGPRARRRGQ
jgi:hypothetical protein